MGKPRIFGHHAAMNMQQKDVTAPKRVQIGDGAVRQVVWSNAEPLALMAGTCALEGYDTTMKTAEHLQKVCEKLGIGLVYKGSYDKANRTSAGGARGIGLDEGLKLLGEVRKQLGLPVLTDVHETGQVEAVCGVVDIVQIPAFLSRQTDLLAACGAAMAGQGGKAVNIKKGQFMAPADMLPAAAKVDGAQVLLTERGTTFGYNNLVVDYRAYPAMATLGHPVVHDASHCVMKPSANGLSSGGNRGDIPTLARAAVAVGIAGIFIETHPDPANAFSDKETQWPLEQIEALLTPLVALDRVTKELTA